MFSHVKSKLLGIVLTLQSHSVEGSASNWIYHHKIIKETCRNVAGFHVFYSS